MGIAIFSVVLAPEEAKPIGKAEQAGNGHFAFVIFVPSW